jgi:tight adherence protein C
MGRRRARPVAEDVLPHVLAEALDRVRSIGLVGRIRSDASRKEASARCLREMPELLDVVTLGLTAGLSFDASLEMYCANCDTALARRFVLAMRTWQLGIRGRAETLDELADELGSSALRRFSGAVAEALEFGIPLADMLTRQADVIREEQRMQMEERIEKVPVKMLVPLGALIVPAMLLAILGPLLSSALRAG